MKKSKNKKLIIIICSIAVVLIAGVVAFLQMRMPYSITADEKDVVILNDKETAEEVVKEIINYYKPEDSKIVSFSIDKKLKCEIIKLWENPDESITFSKNKAIEYIKEKNKTGDKIFEVTIVGKTKNKEDYIPEAKYIKEDDMIAGQTEVEREGETGKQIITRKLTTVNGKLVKTETIKTKILEKGVSAIIHKGTIGLPDGEDWKTFEGDPIFEGADDLIAISEKYQGVPYKYGGTSLITGVDCVQFVRQMFKKYGIYLPNNHSGIRGSGVGVSYSNMKKGDVICYTGHVAIYMGNGKIIHANSKKGVHISNVYKGQKIVTIRRIIK